MSVKEHRQRRERLTARVDPAVAEVVEHVAEAERRPVSSVVRNVLEDWARTKMQVGQGAAA
jgi:predicted transcriptional regulator